jgi:hypothetical protein
MRTLVLIATLALFGCTIDPVVTNPSLGRADDCRDIARDYCRHVVVAAHDEMRACVARHAYECASGRR